MLDTSSCCSRLCCNFVISSTPSLEACMLGWHLPRIAVLVSLGLYAEPTAAVVVYVQSRTYLSVVHVHGTEMTENRL